METIQPAQRIKIFSFLTMNDLLRCSLVSRAWRSFVLDSVEVRSLSCKQTVGHFHEMRYSFNFESIENDRFLLANNLNFLRSEWVLNMLRKNLKRLYIHHPYGHIGRKYSLVSALNQFTQLEQLQIHVLQVDGAEGELTLPNLVCLSVAYFIGFRPLTLNTPKLTSFSAGYSDWNSSHLSHFKFEYPAKIVHLDLEVYDADLLKFVNLEILYCRTFKKDKVASINDFLAALPRLRELHCQFIGGKSICRLLSSKCKLRRIKFNFYFCGFRIETINDLDDYLTKNGQDELAWGGENATGSLPGWKTMLRNPHKLSQHIKYVWEMLLYEELVNCFDRISFSSFFSKIVKIEEVELNQPITDELKLVEFLKACKHIRTLHIENSSLSQSLLGRLPVYQPYITDLSIYDEAGLDLQFIFQFHYLSEFSTNQSASLAFVSRAFRELKLLTSFYVQAGGREFEIGRSSIKSLNGNIVEFKGQSQMLTFLAEVFHCLA